MKIFLVLLLGLWVPLYLEAQENNPSQQVLTQAYEPETKWAISAFNIAFVDRQSFDKGAAKVGSYGYLSFDYKLESGARIALRPSYGFNSAGWDKYDAVNEQRLELADLHFAYIHSDVFKAPGDFGYSGTYKLYLPTSEDSQAQHQILRLDFEGVLKRRFRHGFELGIFFEPSYYLQSQTVYLDRIIELQPDGTKTTKSLIAQNKNYELDQYLRLSKKVTKSASLSVTSGLKSSYYHASKLEGKSASSSTDFKFELSSYIKWSDHLSFIAGVSNFADTSGHSHAFKLFRADELQYQLLTFVYL